MLLDGWNRKLTGGQKRTVDRTFESAVNPSSTRKRLKREHTAVADMSQKHKDDETHLRQIFPTEIWIKVVNNLKIKSTHDDENTLQNLSNSAFYFRNLVLSRRVGFLLPDVVNILKSSIVDDSVGRDILKCRQVCTSWNRSILEYYRLHPSHSHMSMSTSTDETSFCDDLATVEFSNPSRTLAFMDSNKEKHGHVFEEPRNPFPFGSVLIKLTDDHPALVGVPEEWDDERTGHVTYWLSLLFSISSVMLKFGQHILYCKIILPKVRDRSCPPLSIIYNVLRDWLYRMVNLRTLDISHVDKEFDRLPRSAILEHTLLRVAVSQSPIPTLSQLQCLRTSQLPSLLFNELLRANSQVPKLHVVGAQSGYTLGQRSGDDGNQLEKLQVEKS